MELRVKNTGTKEARDFYWHFFIEQNVSSDTVSNFDGIGRLSDTPTKTIVEDLRAILRLHR